VIAWLARRKFEQSRVFRGLVVLAVGKLTIKAIFGNTTAL
jgi:hypothetical protein